MTDDRRCDSPKRGVKGIKEVRQLTESCGGFREVWEGVTVVRKCDRRFVSWCGSVTVIGEMRKVLERCVS